MAMEFKFTPHAIEEMQERGIPLQLDFIQLQFRKVRVAHK
jgi:hypothetical protein